MIASAGCSSKPWNTSFKNEITTIFPDAELVKLDAKHAIYHTVYDITSSRYKSGANKLPELQSPDLSPREGDTTTDFRFDVMYRDMDNAEPASARLFIDGEAYDMVSDTVSGPWNDWVTFYCETTLGVGSTHRYYFLFTDGQDQVRNPLSSASPNWLRPPAESPKPVITP